MIPLLVRVVVSSVFFGTFGPLVGGAVARASVIQTYSSTNFNLSGSASESSGEITLTPDEGGQAGGIFSKSRISVSDSFTVLAEMYFGTTNGGADGIAFVLQPNTSSSLSSGGGIGYADINNAFAIEFDTYQNSNDLANDHSGLMKKTATDHTEWTGSDSKKDLGNIEDGLWHKLEVYWLPDSEVSDFICTPEWGLLTVKFDINGDGDVSDTVSGQSETLYENCLQLEEYFADTNQATYYGFTAATGGAKNLQKIKGFSGNVVTRTNTAPTISSISSQTVLVNAGQQTLNFTVTDDSTTADQWAAGDSITSSNTTAVPTVSLVTPYPASTGAAQTFTLRYTPSTTQVGSSTLTILLTDGDGIEVSTTFTVNVVSSLGLTSPSTLLTFAQNGAENNSLPQTEVQGTKTKLWKNILTRAGYTFTGWNTKADGSGTSYADQAEFTFDRDYITLYAQWSLIKSTPTITWANPAAITTATPLSATQLNATASVAGTCAYTPALGTLLAAGKQSLTCVFTPTDTTKYSSVTKSVEIEVLALPVITWANPAAITNGAALSATQLNATANMTGSFSYSPALATVLKPGKQKLTVTFTPTDSRLSAISKDVEINVLPALTPTAQSITTRSGESGKGVIGSTTADAVVVVKTLGAGLEKADPTRSELTVTAKADYSGKTSLVITVTDEGRSVDLTVAVTVTPLAPATATYRLTTLSSTTLSWQAASGATSYLVAIDGQNSCTTSSTSCQVDKAVGPKSAVTVTSLGGNETQSSATVAAYQSPATPIEAATVNFATGKSVLTSQAKATLSQLASTVASLGLSSLQVQGHTDSVGGVDNQALSKARAKATLEYLSKKLPGVEITLAAFGPTKPVADNKSSKGKASNRRAVVLIG